MLQELAFTGQWRHYQKRVLDKSDAFMADGHLHLVAAPGSGKTTLGIEFIRRFGQPTDLSSYCHHSSAMGGPDYPGIPE